MRRSVVALWNARRTLVQKAMGAQRLMAYYITVHESSAYSISLHLQSFKIIDLKRCMHFGLWGLRPLRSQRPKCMQRFRSMILKLCRCKEIVFTHLSSHELRYSTPSASILPSLFGPTCTLRSRVRPQPFSRLRLTGTTEAERLQEWGRKILTVSWRTVGHSGPVACHLSGERRMGACDALPDKLRRS